MWEKDSEVQQCKEWNGLKEERLSQFTDQLIK
jgi:hypothetical protein